MQRFPLESFGSSGKKHTFASAFEKQPDKPNEQNEACFSYVMARVGIQQRNLKQNEIEKCSRKRIKKEFFEKIYIRQIK